jgi:CRISPR/Cas system-associated exonuclease Cas4 (RecB family)
MSDLIKLSVSKSKTFEQCKKKFHFAYILKLPRIERDYHTFGKFVHKVLEDFHLHYLDGGTTPYNEHFSFVFKNTLKEYSGKITKEQKEQIKEILNNYLKLFYSQVKNGEAPTILSCEKDFNVNIDDKIILNGAIDRIQVDNDGVHHVIDYKTSKSDTSLKSDYFQLLAYAYVLKLQKPELKKIRGSYMMLKHNMKLITFEFDEDKILSVKDKLLKYYDDILSEKEYPPTITKLCEYCDYMNVCESFHQNSKSNLRFGKIEW